LEKEIERCFLEGPGSIPTIKPEIGNLIGVVVPHAGYIFSGRIAAYSFHKIAEEGFADVFIILGPNHTGVGSGVSVYPSGKWRTPLGEIPIDTILVKKIAGGIIDIDENAHRYEHSIEVQLPFLQYISNDREFSIIPICMAMQDIDTAREVGEKIAEVIKEDPRRIIIIASSDLSHEGFMYGRIPPNGVNVDEYVRERDQLAIKEIKDLNPDGLINTVYKNGLTMCGYGPVASLLYAAKKLGVTKAELLKYGTSYEVSSDDNACVGYSAFAIY